MPFSAVLVTGTGTFLIRSRAALLWCEGCGLLCCLRSCSGSSCRVSGGVPLLGVGCSFLLMGGGSGLCFWPSAFVGRLGLPRFVCCLLGGLSVCVFLWFCFVVLGLSFLGFRGRGWCWLGLLSFCSLLVSLFLSLFLVFVFARVGVVFVSCLWVLGWGCGGFLLIGPLHACPGCSCALAFPCLCWFVRFSSALLCWLSRSGSYV